METRHNIFIDSLVLYSISQKIKSDYTQLLPEWTSRTITTLGSMLPTMIRSTKVVSSYVNLRTVCPFITLLDFLDLKAIWAEKILLSSSRPSTPHASSRPTTPSTSLPTDSPARVTAPISPISPMGPPSLPPTSPPPGPTPTAQVPDYVVSEDENIGSSPAVKTTKPTKSNWV